LAVAFRTARVPFDQFRPSVLVAVRVVRDICDDAKWTSTHLDEYFGEGFVEAAKLDNVKNALLWRMGTIFVGSGNKDTDMAVPEEEDTLANMDFTSLTDLDKPGPAQAWMTRTAKPTVSTIETDENRC
jgi:hypothetical protein